MSDYLGNLLARSFDLSEAVQPRPVSPFEPSPLTGGLAVSPPFEPGPGDGQPITLANASPAWSATRHPTLPPPDESGRRRPPEPDRLGPSAAPAAAVQSVRQSTQYPLPPRPTVTRPTETGPRPAPAGQGPAPAQRRVAPQPRRTRPSPESTRPSPGLDRPKGRPLTTGADAGMPLAPGVAEGDGRPRLEPIVQQVTVERIVMPSALPATPVIETRVARSESGVERENTRQVTEERVVTPAVRPARPVNGTGAAPPASEGHPGPEPPRPRPEPSPVQPRPARNLARPEVVPYLEPIAPDRAQSPPAEPPPTIQVTIGRVEVRATPPPHAPKKQRPKSPPVMSLDEYLRQRAGGDRR